MGRDIAGGKDRDGRLSGLAGTSCRRRRRGEASPSSSSEREHPQPPGPFLRFDAASAARAEAGAGVGRRARRWIGGSTPHRRLVILVSLQVSGYMYKEFT